MIFRSEEVRGLVDGSVSRGTRHIKGKYVIMSRKKEKRTSVVEMAAISNDKRTRLFMNYHFPSLRWDKLVEKGQSDLLK